IDALAGRISSFSGVDVALGSRVDRLLVRNGHVVGIAIGEEMVEAPAVVLACGGVGAKPELIRNLQGEAFWKAGGPVSYLGHTYARGDAIKLALQVDAQIVIGHGLASPASVFRTAYVPSFVLIVNALGRRYHDETAPYGVTEASLSRQPG